MRALLGVCLLAVIAATLVVFGEGGSEPVHADHEKPVTPPVPVVDRSWVPNDRGVAVPVDPYADKAGIPALASNLITLGRGTERTPIPVCLEAFDKDSDQSLYKKATDEAIAAWNAVAEMGEPIFRYAGTETVTVTVTGFGAVITASTARCASYDSRAGGRTAGLRSVLVRKVYIGEDCPGGLVDTLAGCYRPERIRGTTEGGAWVEGTYLGRGEVRLHKAGTGNSLAATIAHELGHALGLSHPYEAFQTGIVKDGDTEDVGQWDVLGCPNDPDSDHHLKYRHHSRPSDVQSEIPNLSEPARKLLDAITKEEHGGAVMLPSSACKGDTESEGVWSYSKKVTLDAYDIRAFSEAYSPAAVTFTADAVRSVSGGKVRVSWMSAHVHAEKGFEVQVKVRSLAPGDDREWRRVAGAAVNDVSATFDQPASTKAYEVVTTPTSQATYRVRSLTDAFGSREPQASSISTEVEHAKVTHELNVTRGLNGTVRPFRKSQRAQGATVEITASPASGYEVNTWSASDPAANDAAVTLGDCSEPASTCRSVTMDGPRHVHVTFKAKTVTPPPTKTCWDGTVIPTSQTCPVRPDYRLTVTASGGGSASGTGDYPARSTATATANWNSATHTLEGWSGCTSVSTDRTVCSVYMSGNKSVTATFKAKTKTCPSYTLTATASDGGSASGGTFGGSVVAINATCPTVTGTATATWNNATHSFEGWSGCTSVSADGTVCSVTLTADKSVIATFKKRPPQPTTKTCPKYTFTVSATGGGSASGGGTYGGQVVEITATCPVATATASAGTSDSYTFQGWTGDCSGAGGCSVTMDRDRSATAVFTPRYCLVTARVGSGSGTVSGGGNVHCGVGSATVTATASAGSCFSSWGGGLGQLDEQSSTCRTTDSVTFTKPLTPVTAIAHFKAKPPTYYTLTVVSGSGSGRYRANTYATASASAGRCFLGTTYTFKRWSGDSSSTSRTIRLYMNRNKSVTAVYTTGPACFNSEDTPVEDDGGGPPWTEPPLTEDSDDPDP